MRKRALPGRDISKSLKFTGHLSKLSYSVDRLTSFSCLFMLPNNSKYSHKYTEYSNMNNLENMTQNYKQISY